MQDIGELLLRFQRAGVKLWTEGDKLKFSAPKGGLTETQRTELKEHKDAIIAFLACTVATPMTIPKQDRDQAHPLSSSQRRMWISQSLYPTLPIYNISLAFHVFGALDRQAMERAVEFLWRRHEALRTVFHLSGNGPLQKIIEHPPTSLTIWKGSLAANQLEHNLVAESAQIFQLDRGPLIKFCFYSLGHDHHILQTTMHHIVADGWSLQILKQDLFQAYQAFVQGNAPNQPPQELHYLDYAHWEQTADHLDKVRRILPEVVADLEGSNFVLDLPSDRPRAKELNYLGRVQSITLTKEHSKAVEDLCVQRQVTPFMFYLAALNTLLFRITHATDILIGTPVANRDAPGCENVIGVFINTTVIRTRLARNMSFARLLEQTRDQALKRGKTQIVPFDTLIDALDIDRDSSYNPVFQVLFNYTHNPNPLETFGTLQLRPQDFDRGYCHLDLALAIEHRGDYDYAFFEYSQQLFDAPRMQRLATQFTRLVASILESPDAALGTLELLSDPERAAILEQQSTSRSAYAFNDFPTLFAKSGNANLDKTALISAYGPSLLGSALSFSELDHHSLGLAAFLRQRGIGKGYLVGIHLDRSLEQIIAVLAVIRAGAAYVPLDPSFPQDRLDFMVADAHLSLVISLAPQPQQRFEGTQVIYLQELWSTIPQTEPMPPVLIEPQDPAYVIYTSGSTGRPKGVMLSHGNLTHFLHAMKQRPGLASHDRLLAVTTFAFDISVFDIFMPLLHGATSVLTSKEQAMDGAVLVRLFEEHQITIMQATPVTWRMVVEAGLTQRPLRVICAGEPFPIDLANHLLRLVAEIWNGYGPTETTIYASLYQIDQISTTPIPIGDACANMQLYCCDPSLRLQPIGMPGELLIGGDALARGYLNRPGLTATHFVPNPFGGEGSRLYRSGDLVRMREDGIFDCLGRIDHQVKLRGFRIELGEIEAALQSHPAVEAAVVLIRELGPGDRHLVGYLIPRAGQELDFDSLSSSLGQHLPSYMIPSTYVLMTSFPRTGSNKIDRKALPLPSALKPREVVPPTTSLETSVLEIWRDVLGLDSISTLDNFFKLGGHSISASRVVARIRSGLQLEAPLMLLFQNPTIQSFAAALGSQVQSEQNRPSPVPRDRHLPLTFLQERLWFIHQLQPEGTAYNIPIVLRFNHQVSSVAIQRALTELVVRHESLRLSFVAANGIPGLAIAPSLTPTVHLTEQLDEPLDDLLRRNANHCFDLGTAPLAAFFLIQPQQGPWLLQAVFHHAIMDGWSLGIFVQELALAYSAALEDRAPGFAPLPIQFADYACWLRHHFAAERTSTELSFWQGHLEGAAHVVELPGDRPRPPQFNHAGESVTFRLRPELVAALKRELTTDGVTLFTVFFGAFSIILRRYTALSDVLIGTPISTRDTPEVEPLIGCFVNTLIMRARMQGNPRLDHFLASLRDQSLELMEHRNFPYEQLVEALQPERDPGRNPLFQVMFNFLSQPFPPFKAGDLEGNHYPFDRHRTHLDLTLALVEQGDQIYGELEYATALFDRDRIERLATHFQHLLGDMVAHPQAPIDMLELIDARERAALLAPHQPDLPLSQQPIPQRFLEWAAREPQRIALFHRGSSMTYGELARKANQGALWLRSQGVGPEKAVGLCLDRDPQLIVAIFAVLMAGGAYVPLDPTYPKDRLDFIVEDTQASIVLTQPHHADKLSVTGTPYAVLDQDLDGRALPPAQVPTPENLAYFIYTSGSTGRPKGVAIPHRCTTLLVDWSRPVFDDDELSGMLFSTSTNFDLSIFEIFTPLSFGGAIHIVKNALELVELPNLNITQINTVPTLMSELLKLQAVPDCVRTVSLCGEALPLKLVQRIYGETKVRRVVNLYGPSEDTTYSTVADIERDATWVTIGIPINNTQCYILDRHLNLLPLGVPGELFLGGDSLARGYLYRPSLTADRFIANPYASTPGSRMYKTGDLVRFHRDGTMEYISRLDHQVKLRGFRIELGEIEARLATFPGVAEVLVMVREDQPGNPQLVAYLVAPPTAKPDITELEAYLKVHLPEYMVPSHFIVMDVFPQMPNKKVDRKALPKPEAKATDGQGECRAMTQMEQVLSQIWADVLGLDQVDPDANFFKLGGHSLLAVRVLARIREALGQEIPLAAFFTTPTIAYLAELINSGTSTAGAPPPIQAMDGSTPRVLAFAQHSLWFIDKLQPGNAAYNIFIGFHIRGPLDQNHLRQALTYLVNRHEAMRTTFPAVDGAPSIRIAEHLEASLAHVACPDQTEAERLAREEASRPFDLGQGPLFRFTLYCIAAEHHLLLLGTHHIISDGWSYDLLTRELLTVYAQLASGSSPQLPDLALQFCDYAYWQRNLLAGPHLEHLHHHWRQQLAGAPMVLELPYDKPRPAIQRFHGAYLPITLPQALSERLRQVGRTAGVTNYMVLLSAFGLLLSRYSRQKALLLGSPVAGRNQRALEGLFGFFVNALVLHLNFEGNPSFAKLLTRIRANALDAWSHGDMPFDLLVECLQPDRDLSRNPIFQVMFSLQEYRPLNSNLLQLEPVNFDTGVSHFDLTLAVEAHEGTYRGVFEYNSDLFEADTIARMAEHYQTLLENALTDIDQPIDTICVLGAHERQTLLTVWNHSTYPVDSAMFHEQVARFAAASPDALALAMGDYQLTYRALNHQATALALKLVATGVGPDTIVGICLPRCPSMYIAVLAILKAGGAYLALDPNYPQERLGFMLDDCRPPAIIASQATAPHLPTCAAILLTVAESPEPLADSPAPLPTRQGPDHLAYVIYTSGTTGRPKGVMIHQAGLTNLLATQRASIPLTADDRVLIFSSLNFDASIFLLTWGWQFGVPVLTAAREELLGKGLEEFLIRERITTMLLPPSVLPSLDPRKLPLLQHLIVGGEAVSVEQATAWARDRQLVNAYGPTEVTVWATWTPLDGCGAAPIGKPVANARCYVVDRNLRLQPIGVAGELLVAGAGLARGYLARPQLTAQAFVPNPFADEDGLYEPGQRLYRTGDLVRWNARGELEYMSRIDHQVKIRGFRVEPGEIASRLLEHPELRDALVIPREDKPGELRLVAYLLIQPGTNPAVKALRDFLAERLPDHMIPSAFVTLDCFPLTADGSKVDRRALPKPTPSAPAQEIGASRPSTEVETAIINVWKELLQVDQVGIDDNFFDLGGHSLLLTQVQSRLSAHFKRQIAITELFQYSTVSTLAEFLSPGHVAKALKVHIGQRSRDAFEPIAIIGMAGRFPMADDIDAFWRNLEQARHCIRFFAEDELLQAGISQALLQNPDYVRAMGYLADIDCFDAQFFGYSPREARLLDPQQRQFLQGAWHALEHAGYNPYTYPGRIALFAGTSASTYLTENLLANPALVESVGGMTIQLGNDKDFLPTRVSYKLNLKGPAVNVQTACSTSLVAVHMACASLLNGESEIAMAGGVRLILPAITGYLYQEGGISSPDGHCRAFDAAARGVLGGSGYGVVVLKRLSVAREDGDTIHALIRGTAINNDGFDKIGFTAPSIEGQAGAIALAQAVADVHPDTIGYIEAHGTGTELGDPIEIAALTKAFRLKTERSGFCAIGSVKTNIGHLDAAAGIVGLIKAALVLKHQQIPANLHFNQPNPNIDFANSPFYVNAALAPFKRGETPRRAAVSSFGLGGTNAHAVLEEAAEPQAHPTIAEPQLIPLTAATETALAQVVEGLQRYLTAPKIADFGDIAYTLQVGRAALRKRAFLVADEAGALLAKLERGSELRTSDKDPGDPRLVFMFPGQGAQYLQMARGLYDHLGCFREAMDNCCDLLMPHLGLDLRSLLYPATNLDDIARARLTERLNQTEITQPALFAVSYSLAHACITWGLRPDAMIGHSIGEFVAACLAGVFSLEDALMLVAARGRLMQGQPTGDMLAVPLPEDELLPHLIGRQVSLAAINAPNRCVVSGPSEEIEALNQHLAARDLACRVLHTSHAFHSHMMDEILEPFRALLRGMTLNPPKTRFVSNVSGTWITAAQATDPDYWAQHLRGAVRFADGLATLLSEKSVRFFLEVGPGKTLTTFLQQQLERNAPHGRAQTLRHPTDPADDRVFLCECLGQLWLAGCTIDWPAYHQGQRRQRVPLPTYPFQRDRFWVEPGRKETLQHAPLKKRFNLDDWFYLPTWKRHPLVSLPIPCPTNRCNWLIFEDQIGLGQALARTLEEQGNRVTRLKIGRHFEVVGSWAFSIDPTNKEDYEALYAELGRRGEYPTKMIHLWNLTPPEQTLLGRVPFAEQCADRGFLTLMYLAQVLEKLQLEDKHHLAVVTNGMQEIHDGDLRFPEKATVLGAVRVLPREFPELSMRAIDIDLPTINTLESTVRQVIAEVECHSADTVVALRGRHRWVQTYEPISVKPTQPTRLRKGGTYLITGGLSGVGLMLATHLARATRARLVLTRRSPFPRRDDWDQWIQVNGQDHPISQTIVKLRDMEKAGAAVLPLSGDVADRAQMALILEEIHTRYGKLDGVFHAAGVLPSGMFSDMTAAMARKTFQAKVTGTLVLTELLAAEELDFLMLFSSTSAILGNMGYGDYVAANAFLDAFAQQQSAQAGGMTISVNWDGWQEVGMAVGRASEQNLTNAITNAEGVEAVERILAAPPHGQLVVSTMDLTRMIDEIRQFTGAQAKGDLAAELEKVHADDVLQDRPESTDFAVPSTETEKKVAAHWCEALGFAKIGRNDDFFELGGDSLLGTMLATKHRKVFKIKFGARLITELPTVAQQAAYIDSQLRQVGKPQRPEFVAPTSPTQIQLAALIGELLGDSQVGLRDSFTALGGNLAKAGSLANRLSDAFAIPLTPEMILDQPIVEELAESIDTLVWVARSSPEQASSSEITEFEL